MSAAVLDRLKIALATRYRVERELGAGGMATVYLAHDVKHERDVAIKVLHPDLGAALGGERFLAEIKTTAKLQHPHILPLLDSGVADGLLYYVMPFVRGETLRTRLERERQLPIADAVRIAREVASALEHAHKQGIIHRDIKPENILLQDGAALVADFGIALAVQTAGGARMTQTGLSLGTPQYMSPEQAMGERAIDARSDIYALGAVTYEMLTGEPPFSGASVQAIVAKVLTERPAPLTTVRDTVPPALDAAVMQALAKLPADRPVSVKVWADLASSLTSEGVVTRTAPAVTSSARPRVARVLAGAAIIGVAITIGAVASHQFASSDNATTPPAMFVLEPPSGAAFLRAARRHAITPDGRYVVFMADSAGERYVYVRPLYALQARRLDGTEGALSLAVSPDSRSIAFVTGKFMRRVSLDGGPVSTLSERAGEGGVVWRGNDEIVYTRGGGRLGLNVVPATGGPERAVTWSDSSAGRSHGWARMLDRDRLALIDRGPGSGEDDFLALADLTTGKVTVSTFSTQTVLFAAEDHLFYMREDGKVMAVRIDLAKLAFVGEPTLVGGLSTDAFGVRPHASLADDGTTLLVYGFPHDRLVRIGDRGDTVDIDGASALAYHTPRVSPEGDRVVFVVPGDVPPLSGKSEVWVRDLRQNSRLRLHADGYAPSWSSDGRRVYFLELGQGAAVSLLSRAADGSDDASRVNVPNLDAKARIMAVARIPGERALLLTIEDEGRNSALYRLGISEKPTLTRVSPPGRSVWGAQPSPDGRWIAYVSDETGRFDVYVARLDGTGGRLIVSDERGGADPVWIPGTEELVYRTVSRENVLLQADLALNGVPQVRARRVRGDGTGVSVPLFRRTMFDALPGGGLVAVQPGSVSLRLAVAQGWRTEVLEAFRKQRTVKARP